MDNQEAIRIMKEFKGFCDHNKNSGDIEAFNMAIHALERQIPKKPGHDAWGHNCCPTCGYCGIYKNEWGGRYIPHCENCGQAISWADTLTQSGET